VPVLELLNPQIGLGSPASHGHAATGPDPMKASERAQTLVQLACTALYNRERVVHLDANSLARLETWRPDEATAPLSLDINRVAAQ
jgi:hypothetical protein